MFYRIEHADNLPGEKDSKVNEKQVNCLNREQVKAFRNPQKGNDTQKNAVKYGNGNVKWI